MGAHTIWGRVVVDEGSGDLAPTVQVLDISGVKALGKRLQALSAVQHLVDGLAFGTLLVVVLVPVVVTMMLAVVVTTVMLVGFGRDRAQHRECDCNHGEASHPWQNSWRLLQMTG